MKLWKNLLRQAYVAATKSPDPSTQNGALIVYVPAVEMMPFQLGWHEVLAADCNRLPEKVVDTPERWNNRSLKYKLVQHAERNATETARRSKNVSHLNGLTMVCPWAACTDCAKEIIGTGISRLVIHKQAHDRTPPESVWMEDIVVAHMMLKEAGVEIIVFDGEVNGPTVRHSGQLWTP